MNNRDLIELKERIRKLKPQSNDTRLKIKNNRLDALSISIEIVSGVMVGLITGIFLDKIFTSKPLFLIICLIAGTMASGRTIWQKIKTSKNGS